MIKRILGIWSLMSYKHIQPNGEEFEPYGKDVIGILQYHADHFMSVEFARNNRPLLSTDILYASEAELARLARDYFSYSGRFELVNDQTIVHNIEICIFPNWVGTSQFRNFYFDQYDTDLLTLQSKPQSKQDEISHLVWRKHQI